MFVTLTSPSRCLMAETILIYQDVKAKEWDKGIRCLKESYQLFQRNKPDVSGRWIHPPVPLLLLLFLPCGELFVQQGFKLQIGFVDKYSAQIWTSELHPSCKCRIFPQRDVVHTQSILSPYWWWNNAAYMPSRWLHNWSVLTFLPRGSK